MANNNNTTVKLDEGEKHVASLLEGQAKGLLGDALPKEMNGFLKSAVVILSRVLNDWVGNQGANIGLKYAAMRGFDSEKQAKYGQWGDRLARAGITLYAEAAPAYSIVKNYFTQNKNIKQSFALAMRAEGVSDSFFATGSQLEVIKHQRDVTAKVAILSGQGLLTGLVKKIPSLAMNEAQMMIANVQRHYDGEKDKEKLVGLQADLTKAKTADTKAKNSGTDAQKREAEKKLIAAQKSFDEANKKAKALEAANGKSFLAQKRAEQASWLIEKLDGQSWIPGKDGFENKENFLSMIAANDPTFQGDFTKGNGQGRVAFLNYIKIRAGAGIDTGLPKILNKFVPDTYTPQAKILQAKTTAYQMILDLQAFLKDNPSPVRVTIGNKSSALDEYIFEVFKQHREDMGRKPLSASMQDELRDAAAVIAEAMVDPNRQLHAQALAPLVDGKIGIIKGQGTTVNILKDENLSNEIQTLIEKGFSSRIKLKAGQKAYDQVNFTKEEFFENWNNLSEDEKMVWSTFFSNEMLLESGITKDEIKQYRRRGNDLVMEVMEEMFRSVEKLSTKELHEAGLDVKTARQVTKFVEGMRRDPHNFIAERRQEAMELTAEIGVRLSQDENRPEFLSRILERAEQRKLEGSDIFEETEKEKKTSFADRVRGQRAPSDELEESVPGERSFSSREKRTTGSHRERHHQQAHEPVEGGRHA